MFYVLSILTSFIWPVIILGGIYFLLRGRKNSSTPERDKDWYLRLALSSEDAVSQLLFLLSFLFFGVSLYAINRDAGNPFSWFFILGLSCVSGLFLSYYRKVISTLIVSLLGLYVWWGNQSAEWVSENHIRGFSVISCLLLVSLLYFVIGHLHAQRESYRRFRVIYIIIGLIVAVAIPFFMSTHIGLSTFDEISQGKGIWSSWQMAFSVLLVWGGVILTTIYTWIRRQLYISELVVVLFLACLYVLLTILPPQQVFSGSSSLWDSYGRESLTPNGIFWALFFNVVAFVELLGVIFSGYVRREEWMINLGTFFLFIFIFVKYFDWFFTFMDKSVFFIGAGVLLFLIGWLMEKGRRYIISAIAASEPSNKKSI